MKTAGNILIWLIVVAAASGAFVGTYVAQQFPVHPTTSAPSPMREALFSFLDLSAAVTPRGLDPVTMLSMLVIMYFMPALVATFRRHHNSMAIFLLNLFVGWTFFGWVAALVWSATAKRRLVEA